MLLSVLPFLLSACVCSVSLADTCDNKSWTITAAFACAASYDCQLMSKLRLWPSAEGGVVTPAAAAAAVEGCLVGVVWCGDLLELCSTKKVSISSSPTKAMELAARVLVLTADGDVPDNSSVSCVADVLQAEASALSTLVGCDIVRINGVELPFASAGDRGCASALPASAYTGAPLHVLLPIAASVVIVVVVGAIVAHRKWVTTIGPQEVHLSSVNYRTLTAKDENSLTSVTTRLS